MNTTAVGDKFRDDVANLLRVAGHKVTTEVIVGHKRVDILFEQDNFGKRKLYALEAKNWQTALDLRDLENIYGGYATLLDQNLIQGILVVSQKEITAPAAQTFANNNPKMTHLTFRDFQEYILGFKDYLSKFILNHQNDGLEDYFIPPTFDSGELVEDYIDKWINSDQVEPIAIIASYGMGKTSLSKHITYSLAKRFLGGEPCRVPILVSLGAISREQSLEGLIGTVLAGTNPTVRNYNFPVFESLNSIGRFLILLDGFDEMKHMMSVNDFYANFEEINRLVGGNSKVIILGRPNAFMSDDERTYCLRGKNIIGKHFIKRPGAPQYIEKGLVTFTSDQVRMFVSKYLLHHKNNGNISADNAFITRRQNEIENNVDADLMSRPVHIKMLSDIATDPTLEISNISRFDLYDHFSKHIILRELGKSGRGGRYKAGDWRDFACDLAWYLWTDPSVGSNGGVRIIDIPDQIFGAYKPADEDILAAKRTLMSGALLDEKNGGIYFYAHRSFQEFLVAEYIWNKLSNEHTVDVEFVSLLVASLTEPVFEFLSERDDKLFFDMLIRALGKSPDNLSIELFKIITSSLRIVTIAYARSKAIFSHIDAAIIIVDALSGGFDSEKLRRAVRAIADKAERKPMVALSAIGMILEMSAVMRLPFRPIIPFIIGLLFYRAGQDLDFLAVEFGRSNKIEILRDIIFSSITASVGISRNSINSIFMNIALDDLIESLITISNVGNLTYPRVDSKDCTLPFLEFFSEVNEDYHNALRAHYEADAQVGEIDIRAGR